MVMALTLTLTLINVGDTLLQLLGAPRPTVHSLATAPPSSASAFAPALASPPPLLFQPRRHGSTRK